MVLICERCHVRLGLSRRPPECPYCKTVDDLVRTVDRRGPEGSETVEDSPGSRLSASPACLSGVMLGRRSRPTLRGAERPPSTLGDALKRYVQINT